MNPITDKIPTTIETVRLTDIANEKQVNSTATMSMTNNVAF